jgi:hypothetical protein
MTYLRNELETQTLKLGDIEEKWRSERSQHEHQESFFNKMKLDDDLEHEKMLLMKFENEKRVWKQQESALESRMNDLMIENSNIEMSLKEKRLEMSQLVDRYNHLTQVNDGMAEVS